jgi:hypothetical protein
MVLMRKPPPTPSSMPCTCARPTISTWSM